VSAESGAAAARVFDPYSETFFEDPWDTYRWMRDEAEKRIGHLYPKGPNGETIIAWLWAWSVGCPNPACGADIPLVSNLWLSKKKGDKRWLAVSSEDDEVEFSIETGRDGPGESLKLAGNRPKFRCPSCNDGVAEEADGAERRQGALRQDRPHGRHRRRAFVGLDPCRDRRQEAVPPYDDGRRVPSFVVTHGSRVFALPQRAFAGGGRGTRSYCPACGGWRSGSQRR